MDRENYCIRCNCSNRLEAEGRFEGSSDQHF